MTAYMETVRGQRLLGRLALLVLVLAVLPNILYIGHMPLPGAPVEHIHTPAQAQQHAAHCHLGPSNCGDQPALTGAWWIGSDAPLIEPIVDTQPAYDADQLAVPDVATVIQTPPPRSS